ncbi:RNA-directed DNA polymerase [Parvibaculum sedimenti]|uniref:RNA-directed DNA polymerase n=1 Tax=Parvibaculum sedimenti TaxID=2608632 RepID=A0A6N6VNB7_9HYPH|nr:retron St85 family RNA-directed DNA polymerase [Parvibaculum sedimenti]KAB7740574.1 RNA-directed DNA polymerase [Parvibaculum sedimenti]
MILERIARETGIGVDHLRVIVKTASRRYKTYTIPKRTGGRRTISHPTPEVKFLQRWLVRNMFSALPVHHAVASYREGVGIADNAQAHVRKNYLLKIDFKNFFPSIRAADIRHLLEKNSSRFSDILTDDDVQVITDIVCKNGALSIGAPSSPILSNAILIDFDEFVFQASKDREVIYTRYADDLFLSTDKPNCLSVMMELIRIRLSSGGQPSLSINEEKSVFTSRKRNRTVTGLVLTSDRTLSVGRKKKRQIRTMIHLYQEDKLSAESISYLRGYLAFVHAAEPDLLVRLQQKFGQETMDQLMCYPLVPRKGHGRGAQRPAIPLGAHKTGSPQNSSDS